MKMSPSWDLELLSPSRGQQRPSPRVIGCRDAWGTTWLRVPVRREGIRGRSGFRASILGHPEGPVSKREPLGAEPLALMVDGERAVEEGVDIDPRAGVAAPAWAGKDLKEAAVELHGVVVGDGASILEAADAREVGGRRPPRGLRLGGQTGEARVVAGAEAVKDALGLGEGPRLREAEFDDQPILKGAKEPLHAARTLRRGGRDPADAEFLERASDLGRGDLALELLRQAVRRARIAMKDAMPIRVGRGGQAIAADELAQQQEIAVGILRGAKDARQHLAVGIVDGGEEDEARAAILEPGMVATVHLDEQTGLRHPLAAAAMFGRSPGAGAPDARLAQQALHGGPGQAEALVLPEELGEVVIVRASVVRAGQREDLRPNGLGEAAGGGPSAVAMGERRRAGQADLRQQAPEVTEREAQEAGRVRHREVPLDDLDQDMGSLLLSLAQGDSPPVHAPRVTESLICKGVTESLSYYTHAEER